MPRKGNPYGTKQFTKRHQARWASISAELLEAYVALEAEAIDADGAREAVIQHCLRILLDYALGDERTGGQVTTVANKALELLKGATWEHS